MGEKSNPFKFGAPNKMGSVSDPMGVIGNTSLKNVR